MTTKEQVLDVVRFLALFAKGHFSLLYVHYSELNQFVIEHHHIVPNDEYREACLHGWR